MRNVVEKCRKLPLYKTDYNMKTYQGWFNIFGVPVKKYSSILYLLIKSHLAIDILTTSNRNWNSMSLACKPKKENFIKLGTIQVSG